MLATEVERHLPEVVEICRQEDINLCRSLDRPRGKILPRPATSTSSCISPPRNELDCSVCWPFSAVSRTPAKADRWNCTPGGRFTPSSETACKSNSSRFVLPGRAVADRTPAAQLAHTATARETIVQDCQGRTLLEFMEDTLLFDAVLRNLRVLARPRAPLTGPGRLAIQRFPGPTSP